jgi:hypothetical protein
MMKLSLVDSEVTYLLDALSLQETALVAQYERTPAPGPAEEASIQRQLNIGRYLALALMNTRTAHKNS